MNEDDFWNSYSAIQERRDRARELQAEKQAQTQALQGVDRQIAELLREQERKDAAREDLERLQALADRYAGRAMREGVSRETSAAILKAHEERTFNALEQLRRLIERQLEEEEVAIVAALLLDE